MSQINTSGHMFRKTIVKDLNGNIIDLLDEAGGGYIIRRRQIVNPEKWAALQAKEKDKIEAAKAQSMEKKAADAPDRTAAPSKVEALEKKVESMGSDIAAILKLLNEKKS